MDSHERNFDERAMSDKPIIGYTREVYDLFHIGHLNLLKNANRLCDRLLFGVTVDVSVLLNIVATYR